MPLLSEQEMNAHLAEESRVRNQLFHSGSTPEFFYTYLYMLCQEERNILESESKDF